MIKIIYFVHGTTTDNENKIATGWLDGESLKDVELRVRDLCKYLLENCDGKQNLMFLI